jgi:CRISPR-associated protein Csx10
MPILEITLQGHLLVGGGQASDLGVDLTTARRFDGRDWLPYIPATAVRGAIRLQLEALLRGADGPAMSPYPAKRDPGPVDPVARLFGYSGPLRERGGALEGSLRFGDALPVDAKAALHALAVRPGLEINDDLASAARAKLFFREVAEVSQEPLVFRAPLEIYGAEEKDLQNLRAAVASTDAIGAGRAKGGGAVSIRWIEDGGPAVTQVTGNPATVCRVRLILTLKEPAHFGDGGAQGNHQATRKHILGGTVRGAVAWALLRSRKLMPESPEFRALFLDERAPVSFGDAILAPEGVDPEIHPATRRERRGPDKMQDDILIRELARGRVNRLLAGRGLYLRADDGDERFDPVPPRPENGLVRRTRTRISIDRATGAAAGGRLFSIEHLEPWLLQAGARQNRPARFVSTVEGPGALRHLALLEGLPVLLGAGRNHGLGLVEVEVRFESEPPLPGVEAVLALAQEVERYAVRFARRAGLRDADLGSDLLPLALVAFSDYVPSDAEHRHPLAESALAESGFADLGILREILHPGASGGYDQMPGRAPLKELVPAVGAGSVYVYGIERDRIPQFVTELLPALRRGVGRRQESGCGRFGLFARFSKEDA